MSDRLKILHIARTQANQRLFTARFREELAAQGNFLCVEDGETLGEKACLDLIRASDVLLTGWGSIGVPAALATQPGQLRYICHLTGTVDGILPPEIIRAGLPVTNWGDAPAFAVAEGALAILLASLKQVAAHWEVKRAGGWRPEPEAWIGSMRGLRLGLYGFGAIGRVFHDLCRPFGARVTIYDPYVTDLPTEARRVGSLRELFENSDAVAIHAALTKETERSITAELLALLPDGGIVVNTARGAIVDQAALLREVGEGRLRAGLDVLEGDDRLPEGHAARNWPNLILTAHLVHYTYWPEDAARLDLWHEVAVDNLQRFRTGAPLRFVLTEAQLARST